MINFLVGASGGGKSYEACVFHILAAIQSGRKVITNLPVFPEEFAKIEPAAKHLLEVRRRPQLIRGEWYPGNDVDGDDEEPAAFRLWEDGRTEPPPEGSRVFGGVWDYYDDWKDAKGRGPLFVVDECHFPMPKKGRRDAKTTEGRIALERALAQVAEWYSMHRHFNADVLCITQSYGKVMSEVTENVQIVYRVRKNVALGSTSSYTRKVVDGFRGAVVNTSIRKYDPRFFRLYKSHTQGQASDETNASDVRPFWKHWTIYAMVGCFIVSAMLLSQGSLGFFGNDKTKAAQGRPKPKPGVAHAATRPDAPEPVLAASAASRAASAASAPAEPPPDPEPFAGKGLHLVGMMRKEGATQYLIAISQNAHVILTQPHTEFEAAGYVWRSLTQCAGVIEFQGRKRSVICDSPAMSLGVMEVQGGGGRLSSGAGAAPS
jgi:zona occludens toxin